MIVIIIIVIVVIVVTIENSNNGKNGNNGNNSNNRNNGNNRNDSNPVSGASAGRSSTAAPPRGSAQIQPREGTYNSYRGRLNCAININITNINSLYCTVKTM